MIFWKIYIKSKAIHKQHHITFYNSRHKSFIRGSNLWFINNNVLDISMENDFNLTKQTNVK